MWKSGQSIIKADAHQTRLKLDVPIALFDMGFLAKHAERAHALKWYHKFTGAQAKPGPNRV